MTHPLGLKVIGEGVRIVGSPTPYYNSPMKLDGERATVMRPSSIEGFVFVWITGQQRGRQIHASCLREDGNR